MKRGKWFGEAVRFGIVGVLATALHYGIYFLLQRVIDVNVAYTAGYVLSFVANFYATSYLPSALPRRGRSFSAWEPLTA